MLKGNPMRRSLTHELTLVVVGVGTIFGGAMILQNRAWDHERDMVEAVSRQYSSEVPTVDALANLSEIEDARTQEALDNYMR
jgi:hypothetical protein